jgi:hypothetical protein
MRTNKKPVVIPKTTHEGGRASRITPLQELKRSVMSCLLFEDQFYENGESNAERIKKLVEKVKPEDAVQVAISARNDMHLRHAPLWIARWLAKKPEAKVGELLPEVIQRADELSEFVAMYWKEKKQPLSKQVKKGLAKAFQKFNEYQLAKYNRDGAVKLRDVLFMCHAKPKDKEQEELWKKLVDGTLATPDTWEVALSAGKDKKETWERMIRENTLGDMAFMRNLRNMVEAKVDKKLIKESMANRTFSKVFPYRFIAAAENAQEFADDLEKKMLGSLKEHPKLEGKTVLLIDVSGSMDAQMSGKSEMSRIHAASAIAVLAREICEDVEVFTFSNSSKKVPNIHGFGLIEKIWNSQGHGGTNLWSSIAEIDAKTDYDRMIVFTDEQAHDSMTKKPKGDLYVVNVAAYQNGVGYGNAVHIDGFSEKIIDFIMEYEKQEAERCLTK